MHTSAQRNDPGPKKVLKTKAETIKNYFTISLVVRRQVGHRICTFHFKGWLVYEDPQ